MNIKDQCKKKKKHGVWIVRIDLKCPEIEETLINMSASIHRVLQKRINATGRWQMF